MRRLSKLISLCCLMVTSYVLGAVRMQRHYAEPSSPGWEPYRLPRTQQPWTQDDVERIVEAGGIPPTVPLKLKLVPHRHHNGHP